jgi:hypothetical protein
VPPCAPQSNLGNQYLRERQPERAAQYYARARALLDRAEAVGHDPAAVREARATLSMNSMLLQRQGPSDDAAGEAQTLASLEALWREERLADAPPGEAQETASGTCRNALLLCATAAQPRPWLERLLALPGGPLSATPAARLSGQGAARGACRACGTPAAAAAAAGGKLRMCLACAGVAYCSQACQAADWKRHKRPCRAQAAAAAAGAVDAAAALEDATCSACRRGLTQPPAGADDPGLVQILRCGHAAHARCLDALRAAAGTAAPALCPACDVPFQAPCAPYTLAPDGAKRLADMGTLMADRRSMDIDELADLGCADGTNMLGATHAERVARLRSFGIVGMGV